MKHLGFAHRILNCNNLGISGIKAIVTRNVCRTSYCGRISARKRATDLESSKKTSKL